MKRIATVAFLVLLSVTVLSLYSCKKGESSVTVTLPEDTQNDYTWDTPEFDSEYFQLKSHRAVKEEDPRLASAGGNHEWVFIPLKSGTTDIVFYKYDSAASKEAKTDPFEKVTITYEINEKLLAKETNRVDLKLKEME